MVGSCLLTSGPGQPPRRRGRGKESHEDKLRLLSLTAIGRAAGAPFFTSCECLPRQRDGWPFVIRPKLAVEAQLFIFQFSVLSISGCGGL